MRVEPIHPASRMTDSWRSLRARRAYRLPPTAPVAPVAAAGAAPRRGVRPGVAPLMPIACTTEEASRLLALPVPRLHELRERGRVAAFRAGDGSEAPWRWLIRSLSAYAATAAREARSTTDHAEASIATEG